MHHESGCVMVVTTVEASLTGQTLMGGGDLPHLLPTLAEGLGMSLTLHSLNNCSCVCKLDLPSGEASTVDKSIPA